MAKIYDSEIRALEILYKIEKTKAYSNLALNGLAVSGTLEKEKPFIYKLVYGVLERRLTLDYWISKHSTLRTSRMSLWVLLTLRMAVYRLVFMSDSSKEAAICNLSVELIKIKDRQFTGFINGVLRSMVRNRNSLVIPEYSPKSFHSYERYLSVKYSLPEWFINEMSRKDGFDIIRFSEALYYNKSLSLRVNTLKTDREELLSLLRTKGYECTCGSLSQDAIIINNPAGIFSSDEYSAGLFYSQNQSSALVAEIADLSAGDIVLDLCGAPGGKASHFAQKMQNSGEIVVCDIHSHRLKITEENLKRLGITCIKTMKNDGLVLRNEWKKAFSHVIIDAPCSGMGTIARKPELKWTCSPDDVKTLSVVQKRLLQTAASYVKTGGILIYSTCSILPAENEDVIGSFLDDMEGEFVTEDFEDKAINVPNRSDARTGMLNILPYTGEYDGFFVSKLRKVQK